MDHYYPITNKVINGVLLEVDKVIILLMDVIFFLYYIE